MIIGRFPRRFRRVPALATAAAVVLALAGTLLVGRSASPPDTEVLGGSLETLPSVWLAGDGTVAGAPLMEDLSDLSDAELERLLAELEG